MNWSIPEQRKLADVSVEEKIAEIQSVDRDLMALGLKIPARYFQFSDNRIVKYFANSEGSKIQSYSPRLRVFYFLTVVQDGQVEQTYRNYGWSGGWEGVAEWDLRKRVIDEARSMQRSLVEGKKSPEGKMDLVAGPQVAGIASHESCGHPTEADRVLGREASQAGKSFIPPDGIGMRVGSEVVNVVDDPTVEHAIAYYRTDDEGVKARRRYLYKEGRVTEFLQNRETAAAMHTRSNGSARAVNYNVEAMVRMANTFVEPKDYSVDELLEDVKFGVYMKSFMEWNIDDKRYNAKYAGREAYLVENGEVKHPVRNTIIELTTPAFWSAVNAVGKDLDFEAGFCGKSDPGQALDASLGGPTIRLPNVYLRWSDGRRVLPDRREGDQPRLSGCDRGRHHEPLVPDPVRAERGRHQQPVARIDGVRLLRIRQADPRERHQGPVEGGRGGRTPREDREGLSAKSRLCRNRKGPVPLRARAAGSEGPFLGRRGQVRRGGDRRRDGPGREGMRGVLLEVRGRALPRHVERRGGPRPSGEPLPVDPGAPVPRVERPRDRLRDEALSVQSREGRSEGGPHRRPCAVSEAREGRPLHGRVRPAHLRVPDGPDGRTPRGLDGDGRPLPVREEDREEGGVPATDPVRRRIRGVDHPEALRRGRRPDSTKRPRERGSAEDLSAQHLDSEEVPDEDDGERGARLAGPSRDLREAGRPIPRRDFLGSEGWSVADEHVVHPLSVVRDGRPLDDPEGRDLSHPKGRGRRGVEGHPVDGQPDPSPEEHRGLGRRARTDDVVG